MIRTGHGILQPNGNVLLRNRARIGAHRQFFQHALGPPRGVPFRSRGERRLDSGVGLAARPGAEARLFLRLSRAFPVATIPITDGIAPAPTCYWDSGWLTRKFSLPGKTSSTTSHLSRAEAEKLIEEGEGWTPRTKGAVLRIADGRRSFCQAGPAGVRWCGNGPPSNCARREGEFVPRLHYR